MDTSLCFCPPDNCAGFALIYATEVGVTSDKISVMAIDAMKSGNIGVNPRKTKIKDLEAMYLQSM